MSTELELMDFNALNEMGELELVFVGTVIGGPPGRPGKDGEDGEPGEPGKDGDDGQPGKDGVTPSFALHVEAIPADQPATANVTGNFPHYDLNLKVPRGINGKDGEDGPPGTPGIGTATVYRSLDNPANSTGDDGDLWIKLKP